MTIEFTLPAECTLCPHTYCVDLPSGRLKNTNGDTRPVDLSKVEILSKPIKECPTFLTTNIQPSAKV